MLKKSVMSIKNQEWLVFGIVILIGLATAFYLYDNDKYSLIYYGDSASHLVDARKIVDWNENPGLAQIGTVWLPLPHFMFIPFVLFNSLFTTGFAGLAVNLPCLAITSVLLYKIIRSLTGNSYISFAGAFAYAFNPNILYLGVTAMTESSFMMFFVGGAYYFQRWYQNLENDKMYYDLVKCSILIALATFCRYEGWFIPIILMILAFWISRKSIPANKKKIHMVAISLISFSGVFIWVVYNFLNYGNPLEFLNAQFYSAASQAASRPYRELLYLQPLNVAKIYGMSAIVIYGPILVAASILGIKFHKQFEKIHHKKLFVLLAIPPAFTVLSLLIGIGEMYYWFNSRFLILLGPLLIVMATLFINKMHEKINKRKILFIMVSVLFMSCFITSFSIVPTYADAKNGFNYKQNPHSVQIGEKIGSMYDGGSIYVLTGSAQEQRIMISSGIDLKNFDDIIDSSTWKSSFKEPWLYDKWMLIGKEPDSDAIQVKQNWINNQDKIMKYYDLVYESDYYEIFVRK